MEILKALFTAYITIGTVFFTMFLFNFVRNVRAELSIRKGSKIIKSTVQIVYVEQVDNMYYMYDKISRGFICQANSEQELWNIAKAKYPGKTVITLDEVESE
jgi:hypothetical protein